MIFLSYSFKDKERLLPLTKALEAEGAEPQLDQNEVESGDSLVRKMSEGLAESDRCLLAWSENAVASDHVLNEPDAFYWRHPQPPFILFIRMNGQPDPQSHDAEVTPPPPQFVQRFPRGPGVPFTLITDKLVYAEALNAPPQAKRILNYANPYANKTEFPTTLGSD
jgi:hypothetical protein